MKTTAILILTERRFVIGLKRSEMRTVPAFSRSKAGCKPALRTKMRIAVKTMNYLAAGVVAAVLALQTGHAADSNVTLRYSAQPTGSTVKLEGTSTIHDWTMDGTLIGGFLEVDANFPASAITNAQAAKPNIQATIPVRSLKSYTKKMDEVMQEHMNATKFPRIEYRLIELKPKSTETVSGPVPFDAVGTLTIAGVTRTNTMPVTIERLEATKLKVVGSTPLKMTDFDVKPPAPSILGMPVIKTGDDIKISFEWLAAVKDK